MFFRLSSIVFEVGGSGWESNPPRPATRPATGFEDQEAHRDLTTPTCKDNRWSEALQAALSLISHYLKTRDSLSRALFSEGRRTSAPGGFGEASNSCTPCRHVSRAAPWPKNQSGPQYFRIGRRSLREKPSCRPE